MSQDKNNSKGINSLSWLMRSEILMFRIETSPGADTVVYDQMIIDQLDETYHPVHLVIKVADFPLKDDALDALVSLKFLRHSRLGCVAIVGNTELTIITALTARLTDIKPLDFKGFESLDDAVKYLSRAKMKYMTVGSQNIETYMR